MLGKCQVEIHLHRTLLLCLFMLLLWETDTGATSQTMDIWPPSLGYSPKCLVSLLTDWLLWLKTSIVIYFLDALRHRCTSCFKIHKLACQWSIYNIKLMKLLKILYIYINIYMSNSINILIGLVSDFLMYVICTAYLLLSQPKLFTSLTLFSLTHPPWIASSITLALNCLI